MVTVRCECGEKYHTDVEDYARFVECRRCGRFVRLVRDPGDVSAQSRKQSEVVPSSGSGVNESATPSFVQAMMSTIRRRWPILAVGGLVSAAFIAGRISVGSSGRPERIEPNTADTGVPLSSVATAPSPHGEDPGRQLRQLADKWGRGSPESGIAQTGTAVGTACVADPSQPGNGEELIRGARGDENTLVVDNGTSDDAIVVLVNSLNQIARRMFVRRGSVASAYEVPSGSYRIRFALGNQYSRRLRSFCADAGASEFDKAADFEEDATSSTTERITLHPVLNGNVSTRRIPSRLVLADSLF